MGRDTQEKGSQSTYLMPNTAQSTLYRLSHLIQSFCTVTMILLPKKPKRKLTLVDLKQFTKITQPLRDRTEL